MLFEKPLTPSDVGKLNRLVIPKQHAERNFPMNCGGDSCENGVLLNFMDELGKTWRFRYSYWNSSQSYVLTKGWSRFVKEKRLDAGDVVTFSRHRASTGRLFIGWRRRSHNAATSGDGRGTSGQSKNSGPSSGSASTVPRNQANTGGNNSFKTLRLFGVNLEFQDGEPQNPTLLDSPNSGHTNPYRQYYSDHMDMITFSGEPRTGDCFSGGRDNMWGN